MTGVGAVMLAAAAAAVLVGDPGAAASRLARLGRRAPATSRGFPRRRPSVARRTPSVSGRPPPLPGPVVLDLVAAVLRAGAPVAASVHAVADSLGTYGAGDIDDLLVLAQRHELALAEPMTDVPGWVALLDRTLLLARDAGLAPGPLLTSAGEEERRRVAVARRVAAARLGVRVVLPTGVCLLPAFVLLTVVPLVLSLLGAAS